jgi:hypothetical protein
MPNSATISLAEISFLMQQMPCYHCYQCPEEAAAAERSFRYALGVMLKACGDRLVALAEERARGFDFGEESLIDELIDRIGVILRRLDREGAVSLVGDSDGTIHELEELDARLILLVEEVLTAVGDLLGAAVSARGFQTQASNLRRDLSEFSETTEERNYLLGLGWESEFAWSSRRSQHG